MCGKGVDDEGNQKNMRYGQRSQIMKLSEVVDVMFDVYSC